MSYLSCLICCCDTLGTIFRLTKGSLRPKHSEEKIPNSIRVHRHNTLSYLL